MKRTTRNKIIVTLLVTTIFSLVIYFLVYKVVFGQTGQFIGGALGFFIITVFISTAAKSKQQLDNELKYMSKYHDNHRPRNF